MYNLEWFIYYHYMVSLYNYSSEKNSMLKLMIVGPSGHGKSTLLAHLKSKCKIISQPVTFFDRYASYSASSGSALPPLPQTPLAIKESK